MQASSSQTVTISFYRYTSFSQKVWGMSQMQRSRKPMAAMPGLLFFKPLGTGGGAGYSIKPDFEVYGLLAVWQSHEDALHFFHSPLMDDFRQNSSEGFTIFMRPLSSRGSWSGFSNWQPQTPDAAQPIIAAITRATIKFPFLYKFWSMVPRTSKAHEHAQGLLFSKGIGEVPLLEQATFTVWKSKEAMETFSRRSFHNEAVMETRRRNGFREEMFTRLQPYLSSGSWKGKQPLAGFVGEL